MARIKSKKYTGVYQNKLANGDVSYSINYKDEDAKKVWFTIGKKSDGIIEIFAYNKRSEFINKIRLGEEPPAITRRKKKHIITLDSIATDSYELKALHNKNNKLSRRKYEMHISPSFGIKDIKKITVEDIQKLQAKKIKEFSPKTVNTIIGELSTVFNHAVSKGIITLNPTTKVKKLKVDNARERYLTKKEIELLLEYLKDDEQAYLFVLLALTTGARVGALTKLTTRDINFENKTIQILDEKNDEKYTTFLCNEKLEYLLKARTKNRRLDTAILAENKANLYEQIKDKVSKILNNLFNDEVKNPKHRVVIHTLRHTFASHLAINGTPIFTIQKLLNHKDINMTLRYAKLAPDSGRDSIKALKF
ncbi:MAG: integrase [Sulfurimonas sp.]|nr:MAG: integrase [Sulfurimonas sp.]